MWLCSFSELEQCFLFFLWCVIRKKVFSLPWLQNMMVSLDLVLLDKFSLTPKAYLIVMIEISVKCFFFFRFVECKDCGRKMHQICVLHYEVIWPSGWDELSVLSRFAWLIFFYFFVCVCLKGSLFMVKVKNLWFCLISDSFVCQIDKIMCKPETIRLCNLAAGE